MADGLNTFRVANVRNVAIGSAARMRSYHKRRDSYTRHAFHVAGIGNSATCLLHNRAPFYMTSAENRTRQIKSLDFVALYK